jgi:threonine dehydratase
MIGIRDVTAARERIARWVHHTPLYGSGALSSRTGAAVHLKAECLQRTGSFKVRGALNCVMGLPPEARGRGLVAVSAGNHAQALAFAAGIAETHCTVVMPDGASPAKVEASREYGADVVIHGTVHEAFERMLALRDAHGWVLVHPFDDPAVLAGQGTVGLEIVEDLPHVDRVVVPVGGGGLLAGVAAAVRALRPAARVVGVEPEGAAAVRAGLDAGRVVRLDRVATIADGLAAPMTSELVLEHVRALVDDMVTVTDAEIADALALVLQRTKLLLEPAAAAAVAAVLSGAARVRPGERVAVIASGGNIDLHRLKEILP